MMVYHSTFVQQGHEKADRLCGRRGTAVEGIHLPRCKMSTIFGQLGLWTLGDKLTD